ncbi:hypothetical protein EIP91_008040 [Steccherinum ochraceum]|uniref:Uncharacterized protein n=1 Tax=Steccherinum ochraceum TaxID=92696 RepID=A0A4R0RBK2_9APHY|nr:hypothetical protein EIP91_008040 [Steccherinum ochraceum]
MRLTTAFTALAALAFTCALAAPARVAAPGVHARGTDVSSLTVRDASDISNMRRMQPHLLEKRNPVWDGPTPTAPKPNLMVPHLGPHRPSQPRSKAAKAAAADKKAAKAAAAAEKAAAAEAAAAEAAAPPKPVQATQIKGLTRGGPGFVRPPPPPPPPPPPRNGEVADENYYKQVPNAVNPADIMGPPKRG